MTKVPGYLGPGFTPAPYCDIYVYLPAFNKRWWIPFLIDTGADATAIHPKDWVMHIPQNRLTHTRSIGGIGGSREYSEQVAALFVMDEAGVPHALQVSKIDVGILTASDLTTFPIPSLLGRDILNSGKLTIEPTANPTPVTLELPTV